jgi:monoamine oxidase
MDVAIVGGGVAGCYCAYRLARAYPDWKIRLFEASDRIGGRLWSVPLAGAKSHPAEMGGMVLGDIQHNVYGLAKKELKLKLNELDWSQRHQYLRGVYLDNDTYTSKPKEVPFRLTDAEQNKDPILLLLHAMEKIVPGFYDLWPWNEELSPRATFNRLRITHHGRRPLYEWGFWNVLNDVISNEAYSVLFSTIGLSSYFRNANALESIWVLLRSMAPQTYYRIEGGYQQLPLALLKGAEDVVEAHVGHQLTAVAREKGAFTLTFCTADDDVTKRADRLILALPRKALQLIAFDDALFEDAKQLRRDLDAVTSVPVCKLYLTFAEPWWDRSKFGPSQLGANSVAAAFTDLPMRQCYYFGRRRSRDPSLLLAGFTDEIGVSFWCGLADKGDVFPNPAQDAADREALQSSKTMVKAALKQLEEMHDDYPVPPPTGAFFVDWGAPPHGAGWHDWAPGIKSWNMAGRIRQPNPKRELFICGEAYSQQQGWVEGAINSAEMVMRRLGLERPDWVEVPNYEFEVEGESKMATPLAELIVALSDSLELQRAYGRDQESIMEAFGLSETEKAALRTGDKKAIEALAGVGPTTVVVSKGGVKPSS